MTAALSPPPPVSVVIPAHNAARWLGRAIESVLAQKHPVDLIVVDDGSTDGTALAAAAYAPRLRLLSVPNGGASEARNHGLARATAPFILFLDADDRLEPGSLRAWSEALRTAGADIAFGPFATERDGILTPGTGAAPGRDLLADWLRGRATPPCAVLWRRSFVQQIGGWRPVLRNQDGELCMRALIEGARVTFAAKGRGVWVHHDGPHRISRRTGPAVIASECAALGALEALAAARGVTVSDAFGAAYYRLAYHGFFVGAKDEARTALARSRALGFAGHGGRRIHRGLATILGLERKVRLTAATRRLIGAAAGRPGAAAGDRQGTTASTAPPLRD